VSGLHVEALDINPLHWLGSAASAAAGDVWTAAMTGLWSAALWLLQLAFTIIDAFTTPDLSAHGPLGAVLPTTLWLGATLAVIMMFVQLTVALVRRDGQSIGRVLIGIGQFGLVWAGYLTVAAALVTAATGLEKGILEQMLHVSSLGQVRLTASWPTQVGDVTLATVLGILSLLVVIPAAFTYVLIMFVREAALIILIATAPISAGGLVSETGKVWFWKTLRWFFSCLLISPMAALVLGVGVKLSQGLIAPPPSQPGGPGGAAGGLSSVADVTSLANQSATAHAGMAVVGCLVIAIGACCPLVLFRLLAFVEPGTASGAALRQSWSDTGGMSGILSGGKQPAGSSAATQSGSDGRSAGESGAESQTGSRLASALGTFGAGMQVATSIAHTTAGIGSDVLGQAGVGAPSQSMSMTNGSSRGSGGSPAGGANSDATAGGGGSGGGSGGQMPPPEPPPPPTPPMPGGGGPPAGPGGVPGGGVPGAGRAGAGGAGGAGAAAGSEATIAVAAL